MVKSSFSCSSEFLTEAAGVTITMTAPADEDHGEFAVISSREDIVLRLDSEGESSDNKKGSCGFLLTRSKWDPYPWVGSVERGSIADKAGLSPGDCLLEVEGKDVVGMRVKEIASLIQNEESKCINLQVWRSPQHSPDYDENTDGTALEGPLPEVARKLASAVSGAVRALECPVCLESAAPPVAQCVHGHILCVGCRPKTARCPICRVRLGHGRCLLADKFHRILQDSFNVVEEKEGWTLRERLFGKRKKQPHHDSDNNKISGRFHVKPRQLLARLLLGGFDKAVSAENLSVMTRDDNTANGNCNQSSVVSRRLGELSLNDRAKSASTGELSAEPAGSLQQLGSAGRIPFVNSSNPDTMHNVGSRCGSGLLSVPQTPAWGGSTESVSNTSIRCPVSTWEDCREMVTPGIVLEHLSRVHEGPQIHFHRGTATIPLPTPLGPSAIYVLHCRGDIFFFKHKDEAAWVTTTGNGHDWEWTLYGFGADGTEVKLRKCVGTLEDLATPLPHHIAPLPNALAIRTVEIHLLESRSNEALEM